MTYSKRAFANMGEFTSEVQRPAIVQAGKAFREMQQAELAGDEAAAWQARMRFDRLKSHILRLEAMR